MTDREKAIVMAYTGVVMLTGDKLSIFHKYIEDICGRPIWTHELASLKVWEEIKEKSKNDFLEICATSDEPQGEWIEGENGNIKCNKCGCEIRYSYLIGNKPDFPKFCCDCGADMKKQSEGDDNGKA